MLSYSNCSLNPEFQRKPNLVGVGQGMEEIKAGAKAGASLVAQVTKIAKSLKAIPGFGSIAEVSHFWHVFRPSDGTMILMGSARIWLG